ncbi:hypothetical protein KC19_1G157600 [Ceratodon purpureus]|uniref:Uncharacterized protein n=1 Tax=Ceratodon purpureus TaxID=3225 RepID=A0A8T0J8X6_CERPU|nr:hypothetical protein KC19_1G157600 [Ceratodon purpureus]
MNTCDCPGLLSSCFVAELSNFIPSSFIKCDSSDSSNMVDSSGQASDQSLIMAKKLVYKEDFEGVIVPNSFKVKPSTASGLQGGQLTLFIPFIRKISRL